MVGERVERKLAAILAADVVGYSRLMGEDETGTRARFNAHLHELIKPAIASRQGRIVKTTGDALLVEFASVVDAVQCAVDIQKGMAERNTDEPDDRRIVFRIGINLGDVIIEGDDIHGDGVNVAARLEALADPGGICVSGDVYRQCRGKLDVGFDDLGEQEVKNIADPVRTYRVLPEGQQATAPAREKAPSRWPVPAIAAAILVLIAAGGIAWWQPWVPDVEPASIDKMAFKLPDRPSIAVLPFTNMSGDKEQEYFADGLTEDIITNLARFPGLFIVSRNSTFTYKGKPVKVQKVAEDLGVRYVLEGSVRRAGGRVRINVQLIDAVKGNHLWAQRYDRELKDVFAVQDEIRQRVVMALEVKVKFEEQKRLIRKHTPSVEVYDLFLRARVMLDPPLKKNVLGVRRMSQQLIDGAPEFAGGYALNSYSYTLGVRMGYTASPRADIKMGLQLARKAYTLDDTFGWSCSALASAYLMMRDHDKAVAVSERAITIQPNDADQLAFHAFYLMWSGRSGEAIDVMKRAFRLNPIGWGFRDRNFFGFVYFSERRYRDAIGQFEKREGRCMNPTPILLSFCAATYAHAGLMDKAKATANRILERYPKYTISSFAPKLPFKHPADRAHLVSGLRLAGLPEHPRLPLPDKPSIAVLPFANLSGGKEQEYFADGFTEDIITDLSKISGLFVIARTSSFSFKGRSVDVRDIARNLGVRYVLEGSVRRLPDKIRITAQLIDASSGYHMWAERYDRPLQDIFVVQDEIRQEVVTALNVTVKLEEQKRLIRRHTPSLEAAELFWKARVAWLPPTKANVTKAKRLVRLLIERAPNFVGGYAMLSDLHGLSVVQGFSTSPRKDAKKAFELARKAMELDDNFAWSYVALSRAYLLRREHDKVISVAQGGLDVQPNSADLWAYYSLFLTYSGRPEDALKAIKEAIRLNPRGAGPRHPLFLGFAYTGLERYHEAIRHLGKGSRKCSARVPVVLTFCITAYMGAGRVEEAKAAAQRLLAIRPKFSRSSWVRIFKKPEDRNRILAAMARAGVPE